MFEKTELDIVRRAFAKNILFKAYVYGQPALEEAFATVKREDFLRPDPWEIFRWGKFTKTPDKDPVYLYTDSPFAIDIERRINNGQPSLHASLVGKVRPKKGERVVHRGGPGCLHSLSASISGASAGVRLPCGLAEG